MGVSSSLSSWGTLLLTHCCPGGAVHPLMGPLPLGPGTSLRPCSQAHASPSGLQEMLAIMKSIYDMMGRHTYPILREDAPLEHVERFFQVRALAPDLRGRADRGGRGSSS